MEKPYLLEEATFCKKLSALYVSINVFVSIVYFLVFFVVFFFTTRNTRKYTMDTIDF